MRQRQVRLEPRLVELGPLGDRRRPVRQRNHRADGNDKHAPTKPGEMMDVRPRVGQVVDNINPVDRFSAADRRDEKPFRVEERDAKEFDEQPTTALPRISWRGLWPWRYTWVSSLRRPRGIYSP